PSSTHRTAYPPVAPHYDTSFFQCTRPPRDLHSSPTRRSSDLHDALDRGEGELGVGLVVHRQHDAGDDHQHQHHRGDRAEVPEIVDRKSTRLNSSHSQISYAVFCLKKKMWTATRIAHTSTSSPT